MAGIGRYAGSGKGKLLSCGASGQGEAGEGRDGDGGDAVKNGKEETQGPLLLFRMLCPFAPKAGTNGARDRVLNERSSG